MRLSFSVMSLNLRFGLAEDGPNNWIHRRDAFGPLLDCFPRDFYTFQEANDFQIDFLSNLLPEHDYIGQRAPAPAGWQNNVLFFHKGWQCRHHEHFYLSHTPDIPSQFSDSRWPRQCTLGIFHKNGVHLIIATTHLDFSADVQLRSAKLIRQRLQRHSGKGYAILTGDFNTTPDSRCYAELTSACPEAGPIFNNVFAPPYEGTHHHFTGTNGEGAIDWILYQEPLAATCACVITQQFAGIYPSDHFPVTAAFAVPWTI